MARKCSTYKAVSSGADVKHISWWGLIQFSYRSKISSRRKHTSQRKLCNKMSTCCVLDVSDSHCHFSVLITATTDSQAGDRSGDRVVW